MVLYLEIQLSEVLKKRPLFRIKSLLFHLLLLCPSFRECQGAAETLGQAIRNQRLFSSVPFTRVARLCLSQKLHLLISNHLSLYKTFENYYY